MRVTFSGLGTKEKRLIQDAVSTARWAPLLNMVLGHVGGAAKIVHRGPIIATTPRLSVKCAQRAK